MIKYIAFALFFMVTTANAQQASNGSAGVLRVLDKVTGDTVDLTLETGQAAALGHLRIVLNECRYPSANPSGDAYTMITVFYREVVDPVFNGWLIASAPALNAMDHPRYDIWALRCVTS